MPNQSAYRQMMIVFVTVLLVSLVGGVQAEVGKPIVSSPPPSIAGSIPANVPSPEIQTFVANKLAEIKSAIEQGDINTAQAALQDAMDGGSWWTDWISIYFYIDWYNQNSSGCQYIFLHYSNSPPNIGINLPCMFLAPVVSWARVNGIHIYFYIF
ncbi:hypothetical protein THII_0166 [Thioploca ingrica]|uniref:Uncharacterized protein n=1 Tax=Thioploca ingrica TaxID=40754 RepID=A0A090AAF9_9GAMM|nr:hypothetical protein THII_0166 [Thioploca ingrica]